MTGLSRVSAVAGILLAVTLLMGIAGFAVTSPGLGLKNWLVVMFGIDAGLGELSTSSLSLFNPLDIVVLVLVSLTFVGFWPGPGRPHRVWMGVAIALPLAGTAVLLATGLSGRSALMVAGLVVSFLMLDGRGLRLVAYLGITSNGLLLAGDFATNGARAPLVAAGIAVGYVLLIAWYLWIAARMLD